MPEPCPFYMVTIEREPGWWVATWTESGQELGRCRRFDEALPMAARELAGIVGLAVEEFDIQQV